MKDKHQLPDAFTALIIGLTLALLCVIVSLLVTGCVSNTPNPPKAPDGYDVDTNTNDTRRYIGIPQ